MEAAVPPTAPSVRGVTHPCPGITAEGVVCGAPCQAAQCRKCAARTRKPRAVIPHGYTRRFPQWSARMLRLKALYDAEPR